MSGLVRVKYESDSARYCWVVNQRGMLVRADRTDQRVKRNAASVGDKECCE